MAADGNGAGAGGIDANGRDPRSGEDDPFVLGEDAELGAPANGGWGGQPPETARLQFGDEEVRLPWLEGDGDDEDEYTGYSGGQVIALLAMGLLALAVIGGGIWWAMSHRQSQALVADGSVIPAPKQPYKEKPKDPGGKTFAGTGDTSFAVSEGQTRQARLGQSGTPKPVEPSPSASPAAAKSAAPAAAVPSGVGVQIAAYSNRTQAEAGWTRLSSQYEILSGLTHRVVEGQADIGTVYRLQVVAGDSSAAHGLCGRLKAAGLACQVKN